MSAFQCAEFDSVHHCKPTLKFITETVLPGYAGRIEVTTPATRNTGAVIKFDGVGTINRECQRRTSTRIFKVVVIFVAIHPGLPTGIKSGIGRGPDTVT